MSQYSSRIHVKVRNKNDAQKLGKIEIDGYKIKDLEISDLGETKSFTYCSFSFDPDELVNLVKEIVNLTEDCIVIADTTDSNVEPYIYGVYYFGDGVEELEQEIEDDDEYDKIFDYKTIDKFATWIKELDIKVNKKEADILRKNRIKIETNNIKNDDVVKGTSVVYFRFKNKEIGQKFMETVPFDPDGYITMEDTKHGFGLESFFNDGKGDCYTCGWSDISLQIVYPLNFEDICNYIRERFEYIKEDVWLISITYEPKKAKDKIKIVYYLGNQISNFETDFDISLLDGCSIEEAYFDNEIVELFKDTILTKEEKTALGQFFLNSSE